MQRVWPRLLVRYRYAMRTRGGFKSFGGSMRGKTSIAVLIALMAAGCTTATEYEAIQEAMAGSPELKRQGIDKCYDNMAKLPESEKAQLAVVMGVSSKSNVGRLACTRVFNAMASGRLSYDEYLAMERGSITPELIKVIQGR